MIVLQVDRYIEAVEERLLSTGYFARRCVPPPPEGFGVVEPAPRHVCKCGTPSVHTRCGPCNRAYQKEYRRRKKEQDGRRGD